ncbi:unnamed protein product [Anisakis simplex]|uniref:Transposase n=1 Tax=Anisakis simplex TaxID=6269 RepID=A0A0M3JWK8_ANISI|nr:unnamed protein product [Anisakis simplex]
MSKLSDVALKMFKARGTSHALKTKGYDDVNIESKLLFRSKRALSAVNLFCPSSNIQADVNERHALRHSCAKRDSD